MVKDAKRRPKINPTPAINNEIRELAIVGGQLQFFCRRTHPKKLKKEPENQSQQICNNDVNSRRCPGRISGQYISGPSDLYNLAGPFVIGFC